VASTTYEELSRFFAQAVCVSALSGLRTGATMRVTVGDEASFTLKKEPAGAVLLEADPQSPDLSFTLSLPTLKEFNAKAWDDLSLLGIELVKKVLAPNPPERLEVKIHTGLWDLFAKGYLSVLTQAGPGFMTFLASKGLVGMSKVKRALERFRDKA
jgi:hypothetical protein